MRVPILSSPSSSTSLADSFAAAIDDPSAKRALTKWVDGNGNNGSSRLLECIFPPTTMRMACPRRVKACLTLLICLAIFVLAIYLDIVALLFWDAHRMHSNQQQGRGRGLPLPLLHHRRQQQNDETLRMEMEAKTAKFRESLNTSWAKLMQGMDAANNISSGWCQRMANGQLAAEEAKKLAEWKFDEKKVSVLPDPKTVAAADIPEYGCSTLGRLFPFHLEPLSEEEREFPLAYGMVVHKSSVQVFALLSAIYQPQNAYCLAMDERADEGFKREMQLLADCFPNIFVMGVGKVEWCQFGVVRGVFSCLHYLSSLNHKWQYYQYLSGVDLPLKTNLEMVRIFKQLNGTVNAEVLPFETSRVAGQQVYMKSPMTLWKSSLSALLSRDAANTIVGSEKVAKLLRYLQHGQCSDEALWATIAGNPKELYVPGGFDANYFYGRLFKETYLSEIRQKQMAQEKMQLEEKEKAEISTTPFQGKQNESSMGIGPGNDWEEGPEEEREEPFQLSTYYISRYQVWQTTNLLSGSKDVKCNGKFVSSSCVFGIGDLPKLLKRPELIAHKMYLDYQPAAYFCLWKNIHERALDWRNQQKFQAKVYAELPTVKMAKGASEDELRFFFDY